VDEHRVQKAHKITVWTVWTLESNEVTGLFKFQWLLQAKFRPNIIWFKIGKKEKSLEKTLEINGMT